MLVWTKSCIGWGLKGSRFDFDSQISVRQGVPVIVIGRPKQSDFDKKWKLILYRGQMFMIDRMLRCSIMCLYEDQKIVVLESDLNFRPPSSNKE
jgi:hypothetical protein